MKSARFGVGMLIIGLMTVVSGVMPGIGLAQESTPTTQQEFPVHIRFLNAMTALDHIDVYINGDDSEQRVAEGLAYGTVSDVYDATAPVTEVLVKQNIEFGYDRYLFDTIVPTEPGKEYLVVVSDFLIIPTELDLRPIEGDFARTRGVHAAAQAPAMDIYVTGTENPGVLADLIPLIADIPYGGVTEGGLVPAGTYDLKGTASGTDTVAVETNGIALDAGQVYVVVVIGTPGDTDKPLTFISVAVSASS